MTPQIDRIFIAHVKVLMKSWLGRSAINRDPPIQLVYSAPKNLETLGGVYTSAQLVCGCKYCKPTWSEHFVEVSCEEYNTWRNDGQAAVQ